MTQPFASATPSRRGLFLAIKLAVTLSAVTFLLARQPLPELGRAIGAIPKKALVLAVAIQLGAMVVGAVRWRMLLHAYGASAIPRLSELLKVYLIGTFYNIYLPGGVGGDVLRGVVTRDAFATRGATGAVAVVFIERALGAAGVLALTAIATTLFALDRFATLLPVCVIGLAAVAAGVTLLARGSALARFLPPPLARLVSSLPPLERHAPFAGAFALSLVTQSLVALCGHVLASSLEPELSLSNSFLAMPLAGAAGYFPLTIAGIGPRDMLVKALYERLGASPAAASATAFAFLFATLASGIVGGIVQLVRPIGVKAPDTHK